VFLKFLEFLFGVLYFLWPLESRFRSRNVFHIVCSLFT